MPNVFDDATTSDLIAIVRQWRAGKLPIGSSRPSKQLQPYQPQLPFFTNDSGETIPPYACMQVTGTLEIGARNYLVVDKPADADGTAGAFIFNGPREVADGEEGLAQAAAVLRGFKDSGTATGGEKWSPVSGEWYIEQSDGGQFICCGDDAVDTDVVKVVAVGGGGGGDRHYLYTLTGTISSGSGAATIRNMADDAEIETGASVLDPLGHFDGLTSGYRGVCISQGGVYYAIGPYVVDVRWDDPDLEQSKDGTNYTNIDTAVAC